MFVPVFVFLVVVVVFFFAPANLVGMAKLATFPNNICKEKIVIFHYLFFAHSANVFWNGQVTFLINEMQRGDCRLVFVCLFVFFLRTPQTYV